MVPREAEAKKRDMGNLIEMNGSIREISIDLRRELALRSDGAEVGQIKKERVQLVYPPFRGAFCRAYELHKDYLRGVEFEKEYAPMFVNSRGKAMSYESYSIIPTLS